MYFFLKITFSFHQSCQTWPSGCDCRLSGLYYVDFAFLKALACQGWETWLQSKGDSGKTVLAESHTFKMAMPCRGYSMWTCPPKCSLKLHMFFKKQNQKKTLWYKHFPPSCVDEWGEEKKKITKILVLFFQMALSWNYRLQFVLNYITMQKCTLKVSPSVCCQRRTKIIPISMWDTLHYITS